MQQDFSDGLQLLHRRCQEKDVTNTHHLWPLGRATIYGSTHRRCETPCDRSLFFGQRDSVVPALEVKDMSETEVACPLEQPFHPFILLLQKNYRMTSTRGGNLHLGSKGSGTIVVDW